MHQAGRPARPDSIGRGVRAVAGYGALSFALVGGALHAAPHLSTLSLSETSAPRQSVQVPYNGDFTFTRVRYNGDWAHDYPNADRNMEEILAEFTAMHPNRGGSNVFDLEDPEIFRYPILYLSEPGFWRITDEGARNLREHMLKGGFIIFDDFDGRGHWENWEYAMRRALPDFVPIEIGQDHAVFDTFFYIQDIYVPHPFANVRPQYFGIFEDNNPDKRMMALVVYNGDLAEYWEYAATGFFPVDPTSDSFRIGVNFFIFGLTR